MFKELVTIIVPCYNQAQYLPETLQSVFDQTYQNWECIIVNDGSLDKTEEIALQWCNKDSRFKYIKKDNGGLSSARNVGLNLAIGNWIQFLDSDDYIHPKKFEASLAIAELDTSVNLVVSNFKTFTTNYLQPKDAYCEIKKEYLTFDKILFEWGGAFTIPIHCGLFNSTIAKQIKFDESFHAIEDWIFWLNFLTLTKDVSYINEPFAYYRRHTQGMTSDFKKMQENLLKAYEHIIFIIPIEYVRHFSEVIFRRMNNKLLGQHEIIDSLEKYKNNVLGYYINRVIQKFSIAKNSFRTWLK